MLGEAAGDLVGVFFTVFAFAAAVTLPLADVGAGVLLGRPAFGDCFNAPSIFSHCAVVAASMAAMAAVVESFSSSFFFCSPAGFSSGSGPFSSI